MRDLDDKIIYALNTSLPTESFKGQIDSEAKCRDLKGKLDSGYGHRQEVIKNCILVCADNVKQLKEKRDENRDDIAVGKQFKTEQRKVRRVEDLCGGLSTYCFFYFPVETLPGGTQRRGYYPRANAENVTRTLPSIC